MDFSSPLKELIERGIELFNQINTSLIDSWSISILAGILLCFFGTKIFTWSMFWFGALIGGYFGFGLGSTFLDVIGGVAFAVVFGILCGYLCRAMIRIGFFLGGLLAGGLIGTNFLGNSPWLILVVILSGMCSVIFFRYFVIVATSMWGAIILTGIVSNLTGFTFSEYPYALWSIEGIVFIGGLSYQFVHVKKLNRMISPILFGRRARPRLERS